MRTDKTDGWGKSLERAERGAKARRGQRTKQYRRGWWRAVFAGFAGLMALTVGCQVVRYAGPNGESFSRVSFGSTTAISSLTITGDTNGVRRFELRGYQNDSSQALGAVTEAAVRAAIQGAR